jgi:hypothetical protein
MSEVGHQARPGSRLYGYGRSGRGTQHSRGSRAGRLRQPETGSLAPDRIAARLVEPVDRRGRQPVGGAAASAMRDVSRRSWSTTAPSLPAGSRRRTRFRCKMRSRQALAFVAGARVSRDLRRTHRRRRSCDRPGHPLRHRGCAHPARVGAWGQYQAAADHCAAVGRRSDGGTFMPGTPPCAASIATTF